MLGSVWKWAVQCRDVVVVVFVFVVVGVVLVVGCDLLDKK